MKSVDSLKKWITQKPYFAVLVMAFCFVFFMVFNFGLNSIKKTRGLASGEMSQVDKETSKIVAQNFSEVVEGKKVKHGGKPTAQEQFMYGYLQGKYKAVFQDGEFAYIEVKKNHQPLEFSANRRLELMRNVQALFIEPGTVLKNMKSDRTPASQSFSYEMRKKGELKGRFEMTFSDSGELQGIEITETDLQ